MKYTKNIKFLEDRSAHIHNIGDKLENILVSQCRKVLCDSEINELDEEKNLVRKSRDKLINIDLEQAKKLSDKEMFVGSEVEKELKALGLRWNSRQVKWLYEAVRKFHLEACKYLLKYYRTTLSNPVISDNVNFKSFIADTS